LHQDHDRALAFYTEKLAFQILTDRAFNEKQRWIELTIPGAATGIALFTPESHEDRVGTFVNSSWEVDDIDQTFADLSAKRCHVQRPTREAALGFFSAHTDSEGNMIALSAK